MELERDLLRPHPWLAVTGFGAHIKATRSHLSVQRQGVVEEYPLSSVHHLLIVGGHHIHTSVVTNLLHHGACISFFEPDGQPLGMIRPYGDRTDESIRELQEAKPKHSIAVEIARSAVRARVLLAEVTAEELGRDVFYQGEREIFEKAIDEMEYLVTLEELRRLFRLTRDMYYELMARTLPPDLGFRRRSSRPYHDLVNVMLSFGYAMLSGNVSIAVTGARLDPQIGVLITGPLGLVNDIMEPIQATMVDKAIFSMIRAGISPEDYECSEERCILSDPLVREIIALLQVTIIQDQINQQVVIFRDALLNRGAFSVLHPLGLSQSPPDSS
jgi:CRISPR-associated endonuclease Cas1